MSHAVRKNAHVVRKNAVRKNARNAKSRNENWVQCDKCKGWELFENCGLEGEFDEITFDGVELECRMCKWTLNIRSFSMTNLLR